MLDKPPVKQRERSIPAQDQIRLLEAVERLVQLYIGDGQEGRSGQVAEETRPDKDGVGKRQPIHEARPKAVSFADYAIVRMLNRR